MLHSCRKGTENCKYRCAREDSEGAPKSLPPSSDHGLHNHPPPVCSPLLHPRNWRDPSATWRREAPKSGPPMGRSGVPTYPFPLSSTSPNGNTLSRVLKPWLLTARPRNTLGMQSRWVCQTPSLHSVSHTRVLSSKKRRTRRRARVNGVIAGKGFTCLPACLPLGPTLHDCDLFP